MFILLDLEPPVDLGIRNSAVGPQLYRSPPLSVLQLRPFPVNKEFVDVDSQKSEESTSATIEVWLSEFPSVLSRLPTLVAHGEKMLMKTARLQLYTYGGPDMRLKPTKDTF